MIVFHFSLTNEKKAKSLFLKFIAYKQELTDEDKEFKC